MASFTVDSGTVFYDGRLLYARTAAYSVKDTYENYQQSLVDVAANKITITQAFTATQSDPYQASIASDLDTIEERVDKFGKGFLATKTITYDGSASYNAFTVTGLVAVKLIGYITTPLSNDAATTSVGTATSAAGCIAATAGTAMQTANQIWNSNTPAKFLAEMGTDYNLIGDGEDIVVDGDANLAAGVVTLYCFWIPLSSNGNVVAAS